MDGGNGLNLRSVHFQKQWWLGKGGNQGLSRTSARDADIFGSTRKEESGKREGGGGWKYLSVMRGNTEGHVPSLLPRKGSKFTIFYQG